MKNIDFLPQCFHDAVRRRRRFKQNAVYGLALVGALAVLHTAGTVRVQSAEAALASIAQGDGERLRQAARLAALEAKKKNLLAQTDTLSQLQDDAPLDGVLGEITKLMTESMALRTISWERAEPGRPAPMTDGAPPAGSGSRLAGNASRTDNGPLQTRMVLRAVAASDVEVGIFLGKLASCPLFQDVRLSYSKEVEQSDRQVKQFELNFVVRRVRL